MQLILRAGAEQDLEQPETISSPPHRYHSQEEAPVSSDKYIQRQYRRDTDLWLVDQLTDTHVHRDGSDHVGQRSFNRPDNSSPVESVWADTYRVLVPLSLDLEYVPDYYMPISCRLHCGLASEFQELHQRTYIHNDAAGVP